MKVRDAMKKEVITLDPDENVLAAMKIIAEKHISGLPVKDKSGKLVGMFTEKSILKFILPSYIDKVGKFIYEENPKSTKKKFSELNNLKVSDLMSKEVITVTEDTNLCEAARIMLTQRARRLPVVDVAGRITGIIARCDILRAFSEEPGTTVS